MSPPPPGFGHFLLQEKTVPKTGSEGLKVSSFFAFESSLSLCLLRLFSPLEDQPSPNPTALRIRPSSNHPLQHGAIFVNQVPPIQFSPVPSFPLPDLRRDSAFFLSASRFSSLIASIADPLWGIYAPPIPTRPSLNYYSTATSLHYCISDTPPRPFLSTCKQKISRASETDLAPSQRRSKETTIFSRLN